MLKEFLFWEKSRTSFAYNRELNPLSRDVEGLTALHLAMRMGQLECAKVIIKECRESLDVLDDRGRTPGDLAGMYRSCRNVTCWRPPHKNCTKWRTLCAHSPISESLIQPFHNNTVRLIRAHASPRASINLSFLYHLEMRQLVALYQKGTTSLKSTF